MSRSSRWSESVLVGSGLLLAACPLPDRGIDVVTEDVNTSPVRLIEPIGLSKAQRCECDVDANGCDPKKPEEPLEAECPLPDVIGLPHFLDPVDPVYRFCKCDSGSEDQGALFPVEFFAEDQDKLPDVEAPADTLLAAILLNTSPESNPSSDVSYQERYRSATDPLPSVVGNGYKPDGRPTPYVRRIFVGDPETLRWDLCNGDPKVKAGFNTFTVLVTDRPWNEVTLKADPDSGISEPTIQQQVGVVDVAGGATYDTQTYTFYCSSADDPNNPVTPGGEGNDPFKCVERCQVPGG